MVRQATAAKREQVLAELGRREIPRSLPRDILDFLLHYPFLDPADNPSLSANLKFYQNQQAAKPRRARCEELQDDLRENWDELEWRHDFVQWFFPIREQGVNWEAQPLQPHEIEDIRADPRAMARLLESYRIMLAFYGLRLVDETTGELALQDTAPARSPASYLRRFRNLESNPHNFLRITRILKCLGEFGLELYPPSFLLFLLALQSPSAASVDGPYLGKPSLVRSFDNYWRWCLRNDADRAFVAQTTNRVRDGASWTLSEYRHWVRARAGVAAASSTPTETEEDSDEAELVVTPADAGDEVPQEGRPLLEQEEQGARASANPGKPVAPPAAAKTPTAVPEKGPGDGKMCGDANAASRSVSSQAGHLIEPPPAPVGDRGDSQDRHPH